MEQAIMYCEVLHRKYNVDFTRVTTRRVKNGRYEKIPLKEMDITNIADIIKENNWDGDFSIVEQLLLAHTAIKRRINRETTIIEKKAILTDEQISRLVMIPRASCN